MTTFLYKKLDSEESKASSSLDNQGLFSIIFFRWVNGVIENCKRLPLTIDDICPLSADDEPDVVTKNLEEAWNQELCVEPRLWKAIAQFLSKRECFIVMLLAFMRSTCLLLICVFLYFLLCEIIEEAEEVQSVAMFYVSSICVCAGVIALSTSHFQFRVTRLGMKVRTAITGLLYKKVLRSPLHCSIDGNGGPGNVLNLVSNDVHRFHNAFLYFPYTITSPFEILTGFCLLVWHAGWMTLSGLCIAVVAISLQTWCGALVVNLRSKAAAFADKRVTETREIISGIRAVKTCAWEEFYKDIILKLRRNEISMLKKLNIVVGFDASVPYIGKVLLPFVIFMSLVITGVTIHTTLVFFVLSLSGVIRPGVFFYLGSSIQLFAECLASVKRIEEFLLQSETLNRYDDSKQSKNNKDFEGSLHWSKRQLKEDFISNIDTKYNGKETYISLENVTCAYGNRTVISDVTVHLGGENLIIVLGPVGSGKTSLLLAILQEIPLISGTLRKSGSLSYVPQIPWIFSGTVRDNVVFSQCFDKTRYENCIRACELESDIASFPEGDLTTVGEHGVVLSGGQRARVGLARALYFNSDIYLLDDPLSAVDAKVGKRLFHNCINGVLKTRMRVLVTHHQHYANYATHVIVMNNGKIFKQGTLSEVVRSRGVLNLLGPIGTLKESQEKHLEEEIHHEKYEKLGVEKTEGNTIKEFMGITIDDEEKTSRSVSVKTYWNYFRTSLPAPVVVMLVLFVSVALVAVVIPDWWLSEWTNVSWHRVQDRLKVYIYIGMVAGAMLLLYISALLVLETVVNSNSKLHHQMISALLKAPVLFFDVNPTGRIMNRFSKDLGLMDEIIPRSCYVAFRTLSTIVVAFLIPFFGNYWLGLASFPLMLICVHYGKQYIRTSRETSRLQAISYSPVLSHFSSTLEGLATIRAFRAQEDFIKKYFCSQHDLTSCWFTVLSLRQWLAIRMNLPIFVLISVIAWSSLLLNIRPSLVGLSLVYALQLFISLEFVATRATEVDNTMTSVERAIEYSKVKSEPGYTQQEQPPKDWPHDGNLRFFNVSQVYYEGGPEVLKNITFEVKAEEKIGIVGRTGAGKSSLIAALMRMPDPRGDIIVDGITANKLNLQAWRQSISVIPQNPILFSGTLRKNVDPTERFVDAEIWQVLQNVHLGELVKKLENNLYHELTEGGRNFSVGERQLICLARALLQGNKIIVMDEATANVDFKTDQMIQETIRETFQNRTVLTVAHRISTIMDYNRVLVLDGGSLVEMDKPDVLLGREDSLFAQLTKHSKMDPI